MVQHTGQERLLQKIMTNNPPAFPIVPDERALDSIRNGMTLRDYFAAKAINGILSNYKTFYDGDVNETSIARWSYEIADAMLKARES